MGRGLCRPVLSTVLLWRREARGERVLESRGPGKQGVCLLCTSQTGGFSFGILVAFLPPPSKEENFTLSWREKRGSQGEC